jgi:TonB family protein
MTPFLLYTSKVAIYLAAFYFMYYLLLSRDTLYSRNRVFILLSVIAAFVFPLIRIPTDKSIAFPVFGKVLSDVFITGSKPEGILSNPGTNELNGLQIITLIYLAGIVFFSLKFLFDFLELIILIRKKNTDSDIIRFHGFNTAGFSALGMVFINSSLDIKESEEIIRHEKNHLSHNHFVDIIFMEIVKVFQWFNPAIHLFDRSLRAVHEFQADEGCLKTGITVVNYQRLLINQVFKAKIFRLTNCFSNPSLIKKRMIMMTKERTNSISNLKLLFVLPVLAIVLVVLSSAREKSEFLTAETPFLNESVTASDAQPSPSTMIAEILPSPPPPPPPVEVNEKSVSSNVRIVEEQPNSITDPEPFVVVEEMPMFPGGDIALLKHISEQIIYPDTAKINNIQGRVIVRFAVTSVGSISNVSILKGVDPMLDKEALRVVGELPQFKPGKQGGKPVPVWYMVPITFTLK